MSKESSYLLNSDELFCLISNIQLDSKGTVISVIVDGTGEQKDW